MHWYLIAGIATGFALLAARAFGRRRSQGDAALAAGLKPVRDLTHLPPEFQRSLLWALADGGFEHRVMHGVVQLRVEDVDMTVFDLETLREHRGEWVYLPVESPFRIAGVVTVAVCQLDRKLPHALFRRTGAGDLMVSGGLSTAAATMASAARIGLGLPREQTAELPPNMSPQPLAIDLPAHWRVYASDPGAVAALCANGLHHALAQIDRRDLVVELIDSLVIIYPAMHELVAADAMADLSSCALVIADAALMATRPMSPRGVEAPGL